MLIGQKIIDKMATKEEKGDYFRIPGILFLVIVPMGILLTTMAYLAPHLVPYGYMGPLGKLTLFLVTEMPSVLAGIFYMMWALHTWEAYYALKLARKKNLTESTAKLWALQTFLYGITSLKHLMHYEPKSKQS